MKHFLSQHKEISERKSEFEGLNKKVINWFCSYDAVFSKMCLSNRETWLTFTRWRNIPPDSSVGAQKTAASNNRRNWLSSNLDYLTSLTVNSMHQNPSREANSSGTGQEIPPFHGTWRFITTFTRAHHYTISWVQWNQSTSLHPIYLLFVLILSSPSGPFPSDFPTHFLVSPTRK